jgi:ubiquitin-conjugating enzyme E2 M
MAFAVGAQLRLLIASTHRRNKRRRLPPPPAAAPSSLPASCGCRRVSRHRSLVSAPPRWPSTPPGSAPTGADLSELDLPKNCEIAFPEGADRIMRFDVTLRPDEGLYRGGAFLTSFAVPPGYPHDPPKVRCLTKVYHPNIDVDGNVCLNILREDWKPVLTVTSIVYGLNFLFLAPNPDDPLNKEAAQAMTSNAAAFERTVASTVARGGSVGGVYYPPARGDRTV